jgi:hypothetical protein
MGTREKRGSGEGYFTCPHCGADVRRGAAACPECGSDEATGWAEDAGKWGAGIPTGYAGDDEFDYEEFVRKEFGTGEPFFRRARIWLVAAVVIVLLVLLVVLAAPGR